MCKITEWDDTLDQYSIGISIALVPTYNYIRLIMNVGSFFFILPIPTRPLVKQIQKLSFLKSCYVSASKGLRGLALSLFIFSLNIITLWWDILHFSHFFHRVVWSVAQRHHMSLWGIRDTEGRLRLRGWERYMTHWSLCILLYSVHIVHV